MEESKLTMMQRNKLNYYLRNGEPLPSLARSKPNPNSRYPKVTIRPGSSKKRSKETIINSGVYERELFVPQVPVVNRQQEIKKLQDRMAFNRDIKINEKRLLQKLEDKESKEEINRFDQSRCRNKLYYYSFVHYPMHTKIGLLRYFYYYSVFIATTFASDFN